MMDEIRKKTVFTITARLQKKLTLAHINFNKEMGEYASFKTRSLGGSEDLVQETFLKTWTYLIKGGKINMMKPFLYHTLNNLIIDKYRKRKSVSLETLMESGYQPSVNATDSLIDTLDGETAMKLIVCLPPPYQKVLHMKYIQGLTLKEMALITDCSRNTLAVQTHRGLAKLRKLYEQQG